MNKQEYQTLRKTLDLKKKWRPLASHYSIEFALTTAAVYFTMSDFSFLTIPLLAILMFRNFSLMHDATHNAISDNKRINDFVGLWSGGISMLPFQAWKNVHLQHHFWSGNLHKDPVMALRLSLPKAPAFTQSLVRFTWKAWIPFLALLQYVLFWKLAAQYALKSHSIKEYVGLILPILSWTALFYIAPQGFIYTTFLPALTLYLIAVEVVNFPHHLGLPHLEHEQREPAWEQHKTARTCIYPRWLAHHVVLNFNYHVEHHMFPDAPWYCLEDINKALQGTLGKEQNVDTLFAWTKENRPLDIMDVISKASDKKNAA